MNEKDERKRFIRQAKKWVKGYEQMFAESGVCIGDDEDTFEGSAYNLLVWACDLLKEKKK